MAGRIRHALLTFMICISCAASSHAQLLPEKSSKAKPQPKRTRTGSRPVVEEPELVLVPAGEFRMGSDQGGEDERPLHRVYVSEFYISEYPVSNAEYKSFVDSTGHRPPTSPENERGWPLWKGKDFPREIAQQPVVKVSWDDAVAYAAWLGRATGKHYQLPTEAEWEKAARGGLDQKKYPWGDEEPDDLKAWFGKRWSGLLTLKNVDYGPPNGYGLYGMAGNIEQWVADLYNAHYYAHSSSRDPQGPFEGLHRGVRGGSVFEDATHLRCAARGFKLPTDRAFDVGFRVVRRP